MPRTMPQTMPQTCRSQSRSQSRQHASKPACRSGIVATGWEASDAYWTWRLFHDGYSAAQIERIRRRNPASLADDLVLAAEAGQFVDPSWIPAAAVAAEGRQSVRDTVIGG